MAVKPESSTSGEAGGADEPAGHPTRHEPYGRHQGSNKYRQIMDARSVVDGGGGALAARLLCGLLSGGAPGLAKLHALRVLLQYRCCGSGLGRGWSQGKASGPSWPCCTVACTAPVCGRRRI